MKQCGMIEDLLPLYADNVCSEESRSVVAEHIAVCAQCRAQLEQMGKSVAVSSHADIAAIRRIKRRIRIEKIVLAVILTAVLLLFGWLGLFWLTNTDCTMDYEDYHLAACVSVEADAEGNLWLVQTGAAAEVYHVLPTVIDENGRHIREDGFDSDRVCAYGVTLKQRRITALLHTAADADGGSTRRLLWNVQEKTQFDTVYYYDDETDQKYVLWEREV